MLISSLFSEAISLLCLILVLCSPAQAQTGSPPASEPVILTDEQGEYPLGLHLEILEDPGGELTIDDVSSPAFDSQFIPSQVTVPNYGFTDSAYWVRFSLDNETPQTNEWLLEVDFANMQYVDLYTPLPDGEGFAVKRTGTLRPVSTRDVLGPNIEFNVSVPTRLQQTYYLRFQNGASMTLPLTLWKMNAFMNETRQEQILHGIFLGALFVLLVYNLFLLFSIREANHLYIVIFLASMLAAEMSYAGYLQIDWVPLGFTLAQYVLPLSIAVAFASLVLFCDAYLDLRRQQPKLHWAYIAIAGIWGVLMILTLIVSYHTMAILIAPWAVFSLLFIAIGMASMSRNSRPSWLFLIAWFGFVISFSFTFLLRLGKIPSTILTENGYRLGILWLAVFLSIALADKINILKAETESSNQELRNSEHRLSQILDSLPLGVILYGKDQKPKYANQRTVDIFTNPVKGIKLDLSADRTLAQAIPYFSLQVAGSHQEYPIENIPVYKALQGEPASADDIEMDRGDKHVALEIQASPVWDSAGNVESAVVAIQEITHRKQAEAELEALVEERTLELNAVNGQLQSRLEWLSAVNKIHQSITSTADLPAAYAELSARILQLLDGTLVFLMFYDDPSKDAEVYCFSQRGEGTFDKRTMLASLKKDSPLRQEIELGKTITWSMDQSTSLLKPFETCFHEIDIQSGILAPMLVRQTVVGVLGVVASNHSQNFLLHPTDLIDRMAFDLAVLTQDAVLLDQTKALITSEERTRLARELHDSVTQTLFTASVLAEATPRIWDKDQNIARQNMGKLSLLIRGALAEMRSLLIELRAGELQNQTLDQLIITLVEAARARTHAVITITRMDLPEPPEKVTLVFYRIAREALNNAMVHSAAAHINVSLAVESGQVELRIQDDGCGFDPTSVSAGHLGITIMAERAAEVGGQMDIHSAPGQGTEVVMRWSKKAREIAKDE
jgi:signal transduction histidine kinase